MFIICPYFVELPVKNRPQKSKFSYHKSISRLTKKKKRCYNTPLLVERYIAPGGKHKLFSLNFGGIYTMKNIIIKNLVKNMAGYGEMLNKVGI